MLRPLLIGRAFGIPIYLHWTFFLLPLLIVWLNAGAPASVLAFLLAFSAATFGCVVLHELGHALAARFFGIGTRDITLYPIGGVASLEGMGERPWQEFWIAVAGPAVNVVLAGLLLVGLVGTALFSPGLVSHTTPGQFAQWLFGANVLLVLFNLIPAFPMDGGRVLRSLLALGLGQLRATRIAVRVGSVMALLMAAVSMLSTTGLIPISPSPMLFVIAFFILMVGPRELQMLEAQERARHEEPLTVLPVQRLAPSGTPGVPLPQFIFQPRVLVYTWDDRQGAWVLNGSASPPRPGN